VSRGARQVEDATGAAVEWDVRVLGIDPGSRRTGWGLVEQSRGELRWLAEGVAALAMGDLGIRLGAIAVKLDELLDEWTPDAIALERAFVGQNAASALRLGEVRGVVLAGAGRRALPVIDYPPATVKLAVAGSGAAGKDMVARGVSALLGREVAPGDASDALAVAICHLRHGAFASRLRDSDAPPGRRRHLRIRYAAR
jgi:crossover junction endodeoxyribonuclease RuvC